MSWVGKLQSVGLAALQPEKVPVSMELTSVSQVLVDLLWEIQALQVEVVSVPLWVPLWEEQKWQQPRELMGSHSGMLG